MKLPSIPHPERYVGLFIYDFGAHVSVGYTAGEIHILRGSYAHRHGTAHQICRVDERGGLELRGVLDKRLTETEALCFLRADRAAARRDYDALCAAAAVDPLSCAVEMQLATVEAFDPPHVTALAYPAAATAVLAGWLTQHSGDPGDRVVGGMDAHATLLGAKGERIASCRLPALLDYNDRPADDVLRAVHEPLQR